MILLKLFKSLERISKFKVSESRFSLTDSILNALKNYFSRYINPAKIMKAIKAKVDSAEAKRLPRDLLASIRKSLKSPYEEAFLNLNSMAQTDRLKNRKGFRKCKEMKFSISILISRY
jgi:hypothetical protein